MRPIRKTISPTALDRNGIAAIQSPSGAGSLTLDGTLVSGGAVTLATPQHVTIYAPGDEATTIFTVTGTDREGRALTDTITGVNASTVASASNFATVTSITTDAAGTSIEAGVDGTCESAWLPLNTTYADFNTSLGLVISSGGAMTYTVQHTFNDVYALDFDEDAANPFNHATLAAQTASADGTYASPVAAVRVSITAHTSGSLTFTVIQAGN
jgi:VCBS repeat-containing protein